MIGAILGVVSYLWIAKIAMHQTPVGCHNIGILRSVIEASMFPATVLMESTISSKSSFYQPATYGLSSIPYAVLGALLVVGSKRRIIFIASLITMSWLGLSVCAWAFIMAMICE